jgi:hypothetical protein
MACPPSVQVKTVFLINNTLTQHARLEVPYLVGCRTVLIVQIWLIVKRQTLVGPTVGLTS